MPEYAIEADPGKCTASFPIFDNLETARAAASMPAMERNGLPLPRILVRMVGDAWRPVPECPKHDEGQRPHYDVGVIAPCDRCGESDVLVVTERDYMDEPTEEACRACVEGWTDD